MDKKMSTVRIAAVQMKSVNADVNFNLEHATGFVEHAAAKGAKVVLLPELMPSGYIYSTLIWEAAEPSDGPTVRWLTEIGKRLRLWIGTSFVEADGDDFYNTFVLANPDGGIEGRVRKQTPVFFEAFFFKGARGSHVIPTALGNIGIGICFENQRSFLFNELCQQPVDLILMPHSAPSPGRTFLSGQDLINDYNQSLQSIAGFYAQQVGVPVVLANKAGAWESPSPFHLMPAQRSSFPGLSAIVNRDGALLGQLGMEEGVVLADVEIDPGRRSQALPQGSGTWLRSVPPLWRFGAVYLEPLGRLYYRLSRQRRKKAREASRASLR